MNPSSFALVSCVHGRPAVTEAWARHIATHFSGPVVVAGDDPELRDLLLFHIGNNLLWVPYANQPLGAKWNRAAERAIRASEHCVILGSDDFPSPELFQVWEYITKLKYKWACLDSIYFYHVKSRETAFLRSRLGFGTGRMFPSALLRDLFELKGYAWYPSLNSTLDASLYSNLGAPEDDIVLTSNDSCWILAVKTHEQINPYEKIRQAHPSMLTIDRPSKPIGDMIQWLTNQWKPARLPSGKLKHQER